jgi:hypothetical protein
MTYLGVVPFKLGSYGLARVHIQPAAMMLGVDTLYLADLPETESAFFR